MTTPASTPRSRLFGSTAARAVAAVIVLFVAAGAVLAVTQLRQSASAPSPTPSPTASPSATPTATNSPSPEPTESPSPSPSPTPATGGVPTGPAQAVMSFTPRCDAVPPVVAPATTVLEDGRVIWRADDGRWLVRQLTPESLDDFREQVRSTGLFASSATYPLERRPGTPEPPGHGLCVWSFAWRDRDAEEVEVGAVGWLGEEEEATYYQPSPQRRTLDELARQLQLPMTWYDDDGWVKPEAVLFQPEEYLVLARLTVPELATAGPDFDDVPWPFDAPPDEFGTVHGADDPPMHCGVATAEAVETLAAELAGAGHEEFGQRAIDGIGAMLPWAARNAAVELSFWTLLPDGRPVCQAEG